ncbi:hypothetical protein AB4Y85_13960 [Microvirga sp. 2YAF29]|uniref:hypothetical protein n=1 Tax=Microvirga sp. 2YAF29 TaxID=3233031 RepID=UPI003F9D4B56
MTNAIYTFEPGSGTMIGLDSTSKTGSYVLASADSVKLVIATEINELFDPAYTYTEGFGQGLLLGGNFPETSVKFSATDSATGQQPQAFDLKSLYMSNDLTGVTQTYRITTDSGAYEIITLAADESRVVTFTNPGFLGIRYFTVTADTDLVSGNGAQGEFLGCVDSIALENIRAIDTVAPTMTSIGVPPNGTYRTGQTLDFTVFFSEAVTVGGVPQLAIDIGGRTVYADFALGAGASLTFRYTVEAGHLGWIV